MSKKNLTAVIPTLLKDKFVLKDLINTLSADDSVCEIIIINNSAENYQVNDSKVRIISNGKNLFVNPSWNLGVKEAKSEYVCLVNDDIKIPENYCSAVLEQMNEECGIIGVSTQDVIDTRNSANEIVVDINSVNTEVAEKVVLKPITFRTHNFGIMMFFKKENYVPIPEDLKIFFGDDWIIYQTKKLGKTNAVACGAKVYHLGALSSNSFKDFANREKRIYIKFALPFYKRIVYSFETCTHRVFLLFGFILAVRKRESKNVKINLGF